eukprot:14460206-Alexandrium_andersonii.AAC.1
MSCCVLDVHGQWRRLSKAELSVSCTGAVAMSEQGGHESFMHSANDKLAKPGAAPVAGCPWLISAWQT